MTRRTKNIFTKLIKSYMLENGIGFKDKNPFPVSWRTINSIKSNTMTPVNTKTQRSLCKFFNLDYELDGRDVKILCTLK